MEEQYQSAKPREESKYFVFEPSLAKEMEAKRQDTSRKYKLRTPEPYSEEQGGFVIDPWATKGN